MHPNKKHLFTLMTRPDGLPANVPNHLVDVYILKKGFKKGYNAPNLETEKKPGRPASNGK